jgi:hypothetical protein
VHSGRAIVPRSQQRPGRWLTRAVIVAVMLAATGTLASAAPASSRPAAAPALPLAAAPAAQPTPPACNAYSVPDQIQSLGCAYVVGYANVTKLNGAAVLGVPDPALASVVITANRDFCVPSTVPVGLCVIRGGVRHTVTSYQFMLEPNGITPGLSEGDFPPAAQTFLTFGFVPVSATMHLSLIGAISGTAETTQARGQHTLISTTLSGRISIRLSDVKVNGVPLATGARCRTTEPQADNLTLAGSGDNTTIPPAGYTVARGGPLTGRTTIPAFTGCRGANGEDLDPLFTAPLSGADNYVKMVQGNLCSPETGGVNGCPPEIPTPQR